MELCIRNKDIFSCGAEVLVVPANVQPRLGLGSHISERLAKIGGHRARAARKELGRLELGEAGIVDGDGSGFRWVVHAAVLNMFDLNPLFLLKLRQRTSDKVLRRAVVNSLSRSAEVGARSVALSLMGAGIGGMRPEKCLEIIREAVVEFDDGGGHGIETVFLCVPKKSEYDRLVAQGGGAD